MADKKPKYQTKLVKYGNKSVTLYSLDGLTWSSKRQELTAIKDRLEGQRITLGEIKTEDAGEEETSDKKRERDDEPVALVADDVDDDAPAKEVVVDDDDDIDDALVDEPLDDLEDDAPAEKQKSKPMASTNVKPAPKSRAKKPVTKDKKLAKNKRQAA